ncbi:MAG: exodeoxyribonuclease VII small subunit [Betaproteobacteria bacterium]
MPKPRSDTALTDADPALQGPAYEAAMQELEQLVGSMESGNMPLDQLLSSYQRGAVLLQLCRDRLQAVEDQIKVLDNGAIKPWKGA